MFPKRKEKREYERRYTEKLAVKKVITQRLKNSAIPYKQKLLNKNYLENLKFVKHMAKYHDHSAMFQ